MNIVIDKEFESLLPPLPEDDYKGLEESIKKEGCRDPLVLWGEILVDGHNRYKICTENSIPYQTVQRELKDRDEALLFIIENQLKRRNLTPEQKVLYVKRSGALRVIKEKAKENLITSTGGSNPQPLVFPPKPERVDTRKETAKLANVSQRKVREVDTVLKAGTTEQVKRMENGEKAGAIVKEIKGKEVQPLSKCTKAVDTGKNGVRDLKAVYQGIEMSFSNYTYTVNNFIKDYKEEFKDRNEVVMWIISNQLSRRNLTALQKSELALMLKPRIAEQAKERMDAGNNQYSPSNKSDEGNTRTDEKLGKIAGVSKKTVMDKLPEPKKPVREELGKGEVISKGCE